MMAGQGEHVGPKAKPQSEAETETEARLALGAFRGRDGDSLGVGQCGMWQLATGPWEGTLVTGLGYWERTLALPPPVASR